MLLLAACLAPAWAQRGSGPAALDALLRDAPGWTGDAAGTTQSPSGDVVLRTYVRGAQRAVVVLTNRQFADRVAAMIVDPQGRLAAVSPRPMTVRMLRGCPTWVTLDEKGLVYEFGVVVQKGGPDHPERSVLITLTGEGVTEADGQALLLSLDWDTIRATMTS